MGVYRLPGEIDDRTAALIEPFTVGARAARRSQPKPGEQTAVFGAGTIGIAAAVALKESGCRQVLICDVSALRLEKAERLGFAVCNSAEEDLKTAAARLFGSARALGGLTADVDIYLDAAGADRLPELFQDMGKSAAGWWSWRCGRENVRWTSSI